MKEAKFFPTGRNDEAHAYSAESSAIFAKLNGEQRKRIFAFA